MAKSCDSVPSGLYPQRNVILGRLNTWSGPFWPLLEDPPISYPSQPSQREEGRSLRQRTLVVGFRTAKAEHLPGAPMIDTAIGRGSSLWVTTEVYGISPTEIRRERPVYILLANRPVKSLTWSSDLGCPCHGGHIQGGIATRQRVRPHIC